MLGNYQIDTRKLIAERGSIEAAIDELITLVKKGIITFPYQRYYSLAPEQLFANLQTIEINTEDKPYHLYSYYPNYNFYLPAKFRDSFLVIFSKAGDYNRADIISDYFLEDIRLQAKRYDQKASILDCWNSEVNLPIVMNHAIGFDIIDARNLRTAIYRIIPETRIFKPTWARALLQTVFKRQDLAGYKWLDISAGWGDRLIAAISLDMEYLGYDPNVKLEPGHTAIIEKFGNKDKQKICYEPFETATITQGPFDVVLTSPPYYTVEEYVPGQVGQSIVTYPKFEEWMVKFLFRSLTLAWNKLKVGGYLILHLGDTKTCRLSEATNLYIEEYLDNSSWEGVIGIRDEHGFPRPVWVWQKVSEIKYRIFWKPENQSKTPKSLRYCYPAIFQAMHHY